MLVRNEVRSVTCKLSAYKLEMCGVTLLGTDDLRQHLVYDANRKHLYILRNAGFLKASPLARKHHGATNASVWKFMCSIKSLILCSLHPRRLALDTLYTLRFILYKCDDTQSCAIAAKHKIDLSCLSLDKWDYSEDDNDDMNEQYPYWGGRLLRLAHVIDQSNAGSRVRAWIRRRSGKEYVMLISLVGVIVAVVDVIIGPWMQSQENGKAVVLVHEGKSASRPTA